MKIFTQGNVEVQNIKIGDIHYEYEFGCCRKTKVLTLPERSDAGWWSWKSEKVNGGKIVKYVAHEQHPQYGPNLYDYEAYEGCKMI